MILQFSLIDFVKELHRELKTYCEKEKIPFKNLFLLDNVPNHLPSIIDSNENIEVLILPPNTTSILQPMDQYCYI